MSELLTKTSSFDYSDVPSGSSSFDYSDVPSWENITSEVQLGTPTIQLTKDEAGEETYVPRVSDPNSWSSNALRSMNQLEQGMARTLEILGKKFEIPELEVFGIEEQERQQKDIDYYGTPTRTASFTQGLEEIKEQYGDEEDLGAALERGMLLVKDMSANAVGSFGPVAGLMAAPVAAAAVGVPTAVATGVGTLALLGGSFLMNTGPTFEEQIEQGVPEDKAIDYAMAAGGRMAVLERIGMSAVIGSFAKQFGPKAVIDEIAKDTGQSAAKKIVDSALSTTAGGLKAGTAELLVESGQEAVQMASVGLALDEGDLFPYSADVVKNRLIDAAALGFVGGHSIGAPATFASNAMRKSLANRAEELDQGLVELQKGITNQETDIAERGMYEGKLTPDKPMTSSRIISGLFRTAVAPLANLGRRSNKGASVVQSLLAFPNLVSQSTGQDAAVLQETFNTLKRNIKLPFIQRAIPKKISDEVYQVIVEGKTPSSPAIGNAANSIKNFLGTVEIDPNTGKAAKPITITSKDLITAIKSDRVSSKVQKALDEGRITREEYNTIGSAIEPMRLDYMNRVREAPTERRSILKSIVDSKPFKEINNRVIAKPKSTGFFKRLQDAGVDIDFVDGYLPTIYKTGPFNRRKMAKILQENGFSNVEAQTTVDRIEGNDGILNESDIEIDVETQTQPRARDARISQQEKRTITPEIRQKLREAGLVETDLQGILYKYILDGNRKIHSKNLADNLNADLKDLNTIGDADAGGINQAEIDQIKKVYQATQQRYNRLNDKGWQGLQKWILTSQYILTLPLVGLTALTEPLIILSRISPKYALFGASKATFNGLKNGLRKVFPKIPMSQSEKAFAGILQGLDGVLADRFGDISGVTVARKITNAFFRTTMLTTVTQISRDMAFQAARMQMRNDLKIINKYDRGGRKKTKEYLDSKRRLMEQGIINPNSEVVQDWALDPTQSDPPIIGKAMSKTVDEFIMAPNAVNRPLWMSDPHFAMVAQLKGFLATFGNIVGGRMWREIGVPLTKQATGQDGGRIPAAEMMKYTIALSLIVAASMFIQGIKDEIRYGDDESPFDKLDGKDQMMEALRRSNIFGMGTIVFDALNSQKYGSNFFEVILGPALSQGANIAEAAGGYVLSDNTRALAREIGNLIPLLRQIPLVRDPKKDAIDSIEDTLEDIREKIVN